MANQCNRPRGGSPYKGSYGEPPPLAPRNEYLFEALRILKVGISLAEVYDRVGKSVIPVGKKSSEDLTDAFYG